MTAQPFYLEIPDLKFEQLYFVNHPFLLIFTLHSPLPFIDCFMLWIQYISVIGVLVGVEDLIFSEILSENTLKILILVNKVIL